MLRLFGFTFTGWRKDWYSPPAELGLVTLFCLADVLDDWELCRFIKDGRATPLAPDAFGEADAGAADNGLGDGEGIGAHHMLVGGSSRA
jgi:hypothetical protein